MTTTFEALLAPLSTALKNQGKAIDAQTGSEKLTFETFVRVLMFGFCIGSTSLRRLVAELASNLDADALGLPVLCRSTLKDGFTRFRAHHFETLYKYLLTQIESMGVTDKLLSNIGLLKVIDGSIFPLIKSMEWGEFRTKHKALKIHMELCINTLCVTNYVIQAGNSDERKALMTMIDSAVTYICDRGYFSFAVANRIHELGAFFVMRLKKNYATTLVQNLVLTGQIPACFTHVADRLVYFTNNPLQTEASIFRIVSFRVLKTHFIICTNRTDLTTLQIMLLYAYRWQIELFFKYLKRAIHGIHLFSNGQNGSKVYLHLLLCFVLLQLNLKQKCHKIVNNTSAEILCTTTNDETMTKEWYIATDWVYDMGLKFKQLFKMSMDWLTYLKNSIAQLTDYQVITKLATL